MCPGGVPRGALPTDLEQQQHPPCYPPTPSSPPRSPPPCLHCGGGHRSALLGGVSPPSPGSPGTQGGGMLVLPAPPSPPSSRVWSMAPQVPASGGQHEDRAVSWIFFLIERLLSHCLFYQYGS